MYELRIQIFGIIVLALAVANTPVAAEESRPAIETRLPLESNETPLLMNTGHHAKITCGDKKDLARKLVCISWLNGASAGNGWTQSRAPAVFPDYCPKNLVSDLEKRKKQFMEYLDKTSKGKLDEPAILLFREAMAQNYPCDAN
jgi:hypothetical protein